MPPTLTTTAPIRPTIQGPWTPEKQLDLEATLPLDKVNEARDKLTPEQKTELAAYIKAHGVRTAPKPAKPLTVPLSTTPEAIDQKYEAKKEEATAKYNQDLDIINVKLAEAQPWMQSQIYYEREQLKEEYEADLRELEQENVDELKALEAEWTPQKQLEIEEGMTFEQWGEARSKLTQDQTFAIEAFTQGLQDGGWNPQGQLEKEEAMSWEQWGEERAKLTEDQIYAIENYTQGLQEEEEEDVRSEAEKLISEMPPDQQPKTEEAREVLIEELSADIRERRQGEPEELAALEQEITPEAAPTQPPPGEPAPELIIRRTNFPRHWRDGQTGMISLSASGSQTVAPHRVGFRLYIAFITFFVSDETNITLTFGTAGSSGSMDLGGENEPRGAVMAMGDTPAPCGTGSFTISSDGASTAVGGYAVYYYESEKQ